MVLISESEKVKIERNSWYLINWILFLRDFCCWRRRVCFDREKIGDSVEVIEKIG